MRRVISKLWTDEEGAASVEYALLLVVIVVATMGAWVSLRNRIIQSITEVENSFDQ
ncbi:Flp family type IVb pilin [bacterium]|jgi:Flp pilus assembly pilin Flp|nr:Flp family type IVb pilin [bacterium]